MESSVYTSQIESLLERVCIFDSNCVGEYTHLYVYD